MRWRTRRLARLFVKPGAGDGASARRDQGLGRAHCRQLIVRAMHRRLRMAGSRRASMSRARSRSEEHTSELQSLMRISYAVFCLQKKSKSRRKPYTNTRQQQQKDTTQQHNESKRKDN